MPEHKCEGCGQIHEKGEPCILPIARHENLKGISMGCRVAPDPCSICEGGQGNFLEGCGVTVAYSKDAQGNIEFREASFVPAPRCSECNQYMSPNSNTHWVCETAGCPKEDLPQHLGIYPMTKMTKVP